MIILADKITVNRELIESQSLQIGSTLKIKSDDLSLESLSGGLNYELYCTKLTVSSPSIRFENYPNPGSLTIYAGQIVGNLNINANGIDGAKGEDGEPGIDALGEPPGTHGGVGGNGQPGGDAGSGGAVTVYYGSATTVPTASSEPGTPGTGGAKGRGGHGVPGPYDPNTEGAPGHQGPDGHPGVPGNVALHGPVPLADLGPNVLPLNLD